MSVSSDSRAAVDWFTGREHQPFTLAAETGGALLLHGFMGTPRELLPLGQALAAGGLSARAIQLPGFGPRANELATTRLDDWLGAADRAWAEIAAAAERPVLIGFSMGAAVALHLAARRPPARLVLLAPLVRLPFQPALAVLPLVKRFGPPLRPFARSDFADRTTREFIEQARPGVDLDDPAVRARLRRELTLPLPVIDELRRLCLPLERLAARVPTPTLVLQGIDDRQVSVAATRRLVTRLGGRVAYHELVADHLLVSPDQMTWGRVRDLTLEFVAE